MIIAKDSSRNKTSWNNVSNCLQQINAESTKYKLNRYYVKAWNGRVYAYSLHWVHYFGYHTF